GVRRLASGVRAEVGIQTWFLWPAKRVGVKQVVEHVHADIIESLAAGTACLTSVPVGLSQLSARRAYPGISIQLEAEFPDDRTWEFRELADQRALGVVDARLFLSFLSAAGRGFGERVTNDVTLGVRIATRERWKIVPNIEVDCDARRTVRIVQEGIR